VLVIAKAEVPAIQRVVGRFAGEGDGSHCVAFRTDDDKDARALNRNLAYLDVRMRTERAGTRFVRVHRASVT